jgi:type 1 glutamine amidotransferase
VKSAPIFLLAATLLGLWAAPAPPPGPARLLIVTGMDHPAHHWWETAPALEALLEKDPRLSVRIVEDPGMLDSAALDSYQAVILYFQNWQAAGPGPAARENLRRFVASGGGLVSVHFGCGAWHGEWSEYPKMLGRVWHGLDGPQHDPRGRFIVNIADQTHPVTAGLSDFETDDELYTCLTGDEPVRVIAQATSSVDARAHPMALVRDYGKGRVFLTTLGHDVKALTAEGAARLIRQGCAWAAGVPPARASGARPTDQ